MGDLETLVAVAKMAELVTEPERLISGRSARAH